MSLKIPFLKIYLRRSGKAILQDLASFLNTRVVLQDLVKWILSSNINSNFSASVV